MVDLAACKERNILVCNVPGASNESVAEHAIALFFSVRRNVVLMHEMTVQGEEWPKKGALASYWGGMPGTCREEVMGILGGGELGASILFFYAHYFHLSIYLSTYLLTPSQETALPISVAP